MERSVAVRRLAGTLDRRRAVAPRQAQEALDDPYAFYPAGGNRRLGPANALRSDQPHAAQQPARAPLHSADLLRDNMSAVGAEPPRLALGITRNQFHPVVEDPHHVAIPPHPDLASQVLRSDRVVRLVDLDVAVAVHHAPAFVEAGEATRRQWKQRRSFGLYEELAHLMTCRAVQPGVSNGVLPVPQELVLPFQAVEHASLEGVVLDIADAAFDLPLVGRPIGPRRQKEGTVMSRERADDGVELGLEPVGFLDCGAKVVEDQVPGCAAEMIKRILNTTNEVVCRLSCDRLAVRLA
jgi:hypothetical protein